MATDTQIREIEERLSNTIAGWMPKNARRSAEEGHVHGSGGMGPITGALGFLYKPGVAGGQIAHGDSAPDGTLTLYGGTNHGSTISRVILGSDPKFATAANVWRNAADQVLWQQVSGSDASIFPGIIHANSTVNIGTFAGGQVALARTGSSWNALTFNEALQARTDSAAANVNDPIIRDRTGAVRLQVNSLPTSPQGHIRVNGDFSAAGNKAGNLLVFEHKTNAILVKGTVGALTKTGTGTGVIILPPFDYTATAGNKNYRVEIDSGGTEFTATYRWSDDGGGTWQQSSQPLSGVGWYDLGATGVAFAINDSGGTWDLGDRWDWVVIGTANQVELLRADTVTDLLYLRNVVIEASTSSFTSPLRVMFAYTGAGTPIATQITLTDQSNGGGKALSLSYVMDSADAGRVFNVAQFTYQAGPSAIAWAQANLLRLGLGETPLFPATSRGLVIENIGDASVTTVEPLRIEAQTAGTNIYNIHQMGTTGVNRLAAPTLIGADASPAAGVALELRGGKFMLATGTTNGIIEDASGNDLLVAGSVATVAAVTTTLPSSIRIGGTLGVGQAVPTTSRLAVSIWPNLGSGAHNLIQVGLTGIQSANATSKRGFGFTGAWDLNGKTLTNWVGIYSAPAIDDAASGGALTNYAAFQGQFLAGGSVVAIARSAVFWAMAPSNAGAATPTDHAGVYIENQGEASILNSYAVDIAAQSGSFTSTGTIRALGTAPSIHEPSLHVGGTTAAAVGVLDVTGKIYGSAEIEIDGALNHDGANVGFYGTVPATQQTPTGSRGGNAALASLLTALALTGIIIDGTSA